MKIIGFFLTSFIKAYQLLLSPLLGQNCRHSPTCSAYAMEAIRIHGPGKGGLLALKRLSKCHPWGTHGYDPVPPAPCKSDTAPNLNHQT